jgi:hypothetical protein
MNRSRKTLAAATAALAVLGAPAAARAGITPQPVQAPAGGFSGRDDANRPTGVTRVAASGPADHAEATEAPPPSVHADDDDGSSLAVIVLVVGGLGLLAGVAGLLAGRRAGRA